MEGITYTEVSLDIRPMEGSSCLKSVKLVSDKEPTVCQVPGSALDSQLMEGITYTEVYLDSRPMEDRRV